MVNITTEYEERLRRCLYVRRFSYGRPMLRDSGGPNRCFVNYLFCDQTIAIEFLKGIGLLRSTMLCNTCGRDMTWSAASNIPEGFRWRCLRRVTGVRCNLRPSNKGPGSSGVISPSKTLSSLHSDTR